ncbi:MAG: polysaccharide biosynthesis C-terminal domain-containing protein, partial [Lachnospiraceae bacterium]|nr:polysaccharide biosynthesis C-terminal domain-containing protein [Lachnospiraceae bacterium]
IPFVLLGIYAPKQVLKIMGGDPMIMELGESYMRIILIAAPTFMMNYIFTAFARNDNAPTIAMIGSLSGSMFNIVFDYILMFPMGLGMTGAALATALSPVVTMAICCVHYAGKHNSIRFKWRKPSFLQLISCCQLGISGFVGEMASAVTTTIFNMLLLGITGNIGVAAYGIVANLSLVATAIFNGVSQGTQPLISRSYGHGDQKSVSQLLKWGMIVTVIVEAILIAGAWGFTDVFVSIFNSEGNAALHTYAFDAMRLYFLGYLAAGINIMLVSYFSATGRAKPAFVASMLRGAVAIAICAIVMANILGINGVWLSFLAAEVITLLVSIWMMRI